MVDPLNPAVILSADLLYQPPGAPGRTGAGPPHRAHAGEERRRAMRDIQYANYSIASQA
jgi:hypothetical protein